MNVQTWIAKRWEAIWWEPIEEVVWLPKCWRDEGFDVVSDGSFDQIERIEIPVLQDHDCGFSIGVGHFDDASKVSGSHVTMSTASGMGAESITVRGRLLRNTWITRLLYRLGFDHPR